MTGRVVCNLAFFVALGIAFWLIGGDCTARQMFAAGSVVLVANIAGVYEGMYRAKKEEKPEPATCGCQHCN